MRIKTAYQLGIVRALEACGLLLKHGAEEEKEGPNSVGRETRLKLDHRPHDFYNVKRNFERAGKQKIDTGTHVPLKKEEKP